MTGLRSHFEQYRPSVRGVRMQRGLVLCGAFNAGVLGTTHTAGEFAIIFSLMRCRLSAIVFEASLASCSKTYRTNYEAPSPDYLLNYISC